jgi:hypothetical protein
MLLVLVITTNGVEMMTSIKIKEKIPHHPN